MNTYSEYIAEIEERKAQSLCPKPIDGSELTAEIISQIKDPNNESRMQSLDFFIFNILPGTTAAAGEKAKFLKEIILRELKIKEINPAFAFEMLSYGPGVGSKRGGIGLRRGGL